MTLVQGVVLFIFVKIISDFIGFTTISYLMNQVINYGAIAAVVIFAPELRSALETFGRTPQHFLQNKEVSSDEKLVQAFVKAVKYMSPRKIGALVSRTDCDRDSARCSGDWGTSNKYLHTKYAAS